MPNALDTFRAQQEAAEQVHRSLKEISSLLGTLREQIAGLSLNTDLRVALREERDWLTQAQRTVAEIRDWRERESRGFWVAVFWRWTLACAFALLSAYITAAGYARIVNRDAGQRAELASSAEFGRLIERRLQELTPPQRREFERLMKLSPATEHRK